jgi:hypothetical protein
LSLLSMLHHGSSRAQGNAVGGPALIIAGRSKPKTGNIVLPFAASAIMEELGIAFIYPAFSIANSESGDFLRKAPIASWMATNRRRGKCAVWQSPPLTGRPPFESRQTRRPLRRLTPALTILLRNVSANAIPSCPSADSDPAIRRTIDTIRWRPTGPPRND